MKYIIPGQPIPLARPRFSNNHVYDGQQGEKRAAATNLRFMHNGELHEGPLHVDLKFFMKHKTKRGSWHTYKPDLDNLTKFILDVAIGILYEDDKQVAKITAEKIYASEGRTEIVIIPLGEEKWAEKEHS